MNAGAADVTMEWLWLSCAELCSEAAHVTKVVLCCFSRSYINVLMTERIVL
jgi:hypothetical protein